MTQDRARNLVRNALKRGTLIRPDTCSKCGDTPTPAKDGRSRIQGHHHDYSKPLDVEWLCAKCHRSETPLPKIMGASCFGEKNGQSRLTAAQAKEIRESPMGCIRLARIYGVHKSTIQNVRKGRYWAASPAKENSNGNG